MDSLFNITTTHNIYGNELLKLGLSVLIGSVLGLEREVRGKSAGFRTLALICFGATIFTICSYLLGVQDNRDRIAANVLTGVGFLGAGVIFRNNVSISGITTAASIWVAAAIGMLIGIGEYWLALISAGFSLIILYALDFIQMKIDYRFEHRSYKAVFTREIEAEAFYTYVKSLNIKFHKSKIYRNDHQVTIEFEVSGKECNLHLFNEWLLENKQVISFEW
ncbi:MgtC/SapB family protein [Mucilaginibacter sp. X4EP1]|uniref:MgtC/SapB family protein n=1 Tax=Mucilaginibacter sp. X4EP1 TaxID=2723092 RepID=UPI0021695E8D|nr:MgtC/SapB family protein [Mucilaginibacter sp. X4EP1]MCS3815133.1 putative Mg2+ transporter-C (MgtC) family protein [Mucilaginibacter sp. X4EP1]